MRYLMYQPAMPDTASHASTRRQARTDGGGGEKESSVPELCSLESVCGQACVYRHIARCVFTTIFINHKYSCSGVFNFNSESMSHNDSMCIAVALYCLCSVAYKATFVHDQMTTS